MSNSLFFSPLERQAFKNRPAGSPLGDLFWTLLNRAEERAASPGLIDRKTTCDWWHCTTEYLTDGAMAFCLKPSESLACWLREVSLSIARRPQTDWIGPGFRSHEENPRGHLETAHLSIALAVVLDLAGEVFSAAEVEEIASVLRGTAIPLCRSWLDRCGVLMNWNCVLCAGVALPAAVLDEGADLDYAAGWLEILDQTIQDDGSYGEGLQYLSYAAHNIMLIREALVRRRPDAMSGIPPASLARAARWYAASRFYEKPLTGWGAAPIPRAANFNDAAAITAASPDLLLHIASRCRETMPLEAGLARWLFDRQVLPVRQKGPFDRASFAFVNRPGFLVLPLYALAADPLSPEEVGMDVFQSFSCGDAIARDAWEGQTILATHGGGEALNVANHLHADLNSFILVHRQERLLVDPGHSCYRGLLRETDVSTRFHNTCTFTLSNGFVLGQHTRCSRPLKDGVPGAPPERGAQRLLAERSGSLSAIASEAGPLYPTPLKSFSRCWLQCGAEALFIVDRLRADEPVGTCWNWILNNRDGGLELKCLPPDRLVARLGCAGMKLFHLGGAKLQVPQNACLHDAYHPLPGQLGEGRSGSAIKVSWQDYGSTTRRTAVHAIALGSYGGIAAWHLVQSEGGRLGLEGPGESWYLEVDEEKNQLRVENSRKGRWRIDTPEEGPWSLSALQGEEETS
ncbi:MAG: heparinase II/III family protein [Planctomycetes bacterium]|nr:heparinase II/III family protein [Planctomycetota bacterium]